MKKITSIIFAIFVASSMCANVITQVDDLLTREQITKGYFQSPVNTVDLSANQTAEAEEPIDTIEVYFDFLYGDPFYEPLDTIVGRGGDTAVVGGDWYFIMRNQKYQFIFDFIGGTPEDPTGVYTEKDLKIDYSWCAIPAANGNTSYYKTCNLIVNAEKRGRNCTFYTLEAEVVTTLGVGEPVNGAFKIYAEHQSIIPADSVETAFLNANITLNEDGYTFYGKNDSLEITMPMYTELGAVGYFSEKQLDEDGFAMTYKGKSYEIMDMEAIITPNELKTGEFAYSGFIYLYTQDTTFFNIVFQAPVIPIETINVDCHNLILEDRYGASDATIYFDASNDDYSIWGAYNDTKITTPECYEGTTVSGHAGVEITDKATKQTMQAFQTKLCVTSTLKDGYILNIEALGSDHKIYTGKLFWLIPTPIDTVDITFETSAKHLYRPSDNELQLINYNNDYTASFVFLNVRFLWDDSFVLKNLYYDQSFITNHTTGKDIRVDLSKVNGTLTQKGDSTFVKATVIGFDSVLYNINMYYTAPTPTKTVTYNYSENEVLFINYLVTDGKYEFNAISNDEKLLANICVSAKQIPGTYINDGMFYQYDFDNERTNIQVYNTTKGEYDKFLIEKGTMTVTMDETTRLIHAEAALICDNAVQYNLTFDAQYDHNHLDGDSEDTPLDIQYIEGKNCEILVQDFIKTHGIIEILLSGIDPISNNETEAQFYFYSNTWDKQIKVPAGVYPINGSGKEGTMLASRGPLQDGPSLIASPSYHVIYDSEYYPINTWWIIEGTTTVENNEGGLSFVVDAINSYNQPVKISFTSIATDVENITVEKASSQKKIINGQLVIIRNGETYNVVGAKIQ